MFEILKLDIIYKQQLKPKIDLYLDRDTELDLSG